MITLSSPRPSGRKPCYWNGAWLAGNRPITMVFMYNKQNHALVDFCKDLQLDYIWKWKSSLAGRARDSWWGGSGFDPGYGRPLPTGLVGVSMMWPAENRSHGLRDLSRMWQHLKLSDVSLGNLPLYSLDIDEEVKKPTYQTNKLTSWLWKAWIINEDCDGYFT